MDLSNIIGYAAMVCLVMSNTMRVRKTFLILKSFGNIFYAFHFYLLKAQNGIIISIIYFIADVTSIPKLSTKKQIILRIVLSILAFIFSYNSMKDNIVEFLPFFALIVNIFVICLRDNLLMRVLLLIFTIPSWFLYGYFINSTPLIVAQLIFAVSNVVGIYKIYKTRTFNHHEENP